MAPLCSRRHRFPPEIIQYAIWLYLRFTRSYIETLRNCWPNEGSTSPTKRRWVLKFGPPIARRLRQRRPGPAERSLTIDHVLGAANYRSLHDDEPPTRPGIVGMQWI